MNCQEFRAKWPNDADEAALSHVEACDSCLEWIETTFAAPEEVLFMKEYPQPPDQLEDRIMQAIYASTKNVSIPPLTAASQYLDPLSEKRSKRRFRPAAWISAAAALVIVGLVGAQTLKHNAGDQLAAGRGENFAFQSESSGASPRISMDMSSQAPANSPTSAAAPKEKPQEANDGKTKKQPAANQASGQADKSVVAADNQLALAADIPAQQKADTLAGTAHKALPSRSNPDVSNRAANAIAGEEGKEQKNDKASGTEAADAAPEGQLTDSEQGIASLTAIEEPATGDSGTEAAVEGSGSQASHPAEANKSITISTFTDAKTAARASNIPVPTLAKAPEDFSLEGLTLQYESETSNRVSEVMTTYKRGDDKITIQVLPNDVHKRSLSIPGTFVDRRLFVINGNQAIGVTYDQKSHEAVAPHAVHFITTHGKLSFYVIMTGKGITLTQLIEQAENLSWHD
ncbi:hypothetical protein ACI7RC_18065 [Brevibacillus sp. B_LB10_24]|uniref:hypothetical protein n=1 Tax=Brevibacillus sp. B_LB10_24 TaxID=3380645 RepID=UPI0038BD99CF